MAATLQQVLDELLGSKKKIAELEKKVMLLENRADKAETNLDSIGTKIDDATAKANDAIGKANTASSDSKSALTKVGTAVNKANDAFGKASSASSAAEYAKTQAASAKSASDKTTSDLSTLRSTVTGQGTDLTGIKKRIDDMNTRVPTSIEYSDLKTVLGIFSSSPINQTKVSNAKWLVDPANFAGIKFIGGRANSEANLKAAVRAQIDSVYVQSQVDEPFLAGRIMNGKGAVKGTSGQVDISSLPDVVSFQAYFNPRTIPIRTMVGDLKVAVGDFKVKDFTDLKASLDGKLKMIKDGVSCLKTNFGALKDGLREDAGDFKKVLDDFGTALQNEWDAQTPGIFAAKDWVKLIRQIVKGTAAIIKSKVEGIQTCLTTMETNLK